MSKHTLLISVALVGFVALHPAIAKPSLYIIGSVPNSISTNIFGVNDKGIATGSWLDTSGVEHGYVGSPSGSGYTIFDDPNEPRPGTEPRGISDGGYICGFGSSSTNKTASYVTWERDNNGTITEVTKGGTVLNSLCQGLNTREEFAGSYVNSSLATLGYLGRNAKYAKGVALSGITNTGVAARGVDNAGDVVGWYADTNGVQHGFLLSGGTASTIDVPGAADTELEGINNKGQISGQSKAPSGRIRGFIYTISTKAFKEIKVPGSYSFVQAWGINDKGQVAVGSDGGYYVYCPSSNDCTFPGKRVANQAAQKSTYRPQPLLP